MTTKNNAPKPNKKHKNDPHLLGAHFSTSGGLHNALIEAHRHQCNALQVFTKNANTWKERKLSDVEIDIFKETWKNLPIDIIASHTSYLINLASPEKRKNAMSRRALGQEMIRSSQLGIQCVVLHPGSHMGSGEKEGVDRIASGINTVFDSLPEVKPRLLLETTAGQGSSVGHTFEQIASILEQIENKSCVGVCLDTCHIFAAGYDIRDQKSYAETIARFDQIVGLSNLYLIHLNDSKKVFASKVDRHGHIGEGHIGLDAFALVMNDEGLSHIPKILETPKGEASQEWDHINLRKLRSLINR